MILSSAEIFGSFARSRCFALDDVHQQVAAAQRNLRIAMTQRVSDALNCLLPNRFAKPDAEFLDVENSRRRGEEMTELVHDDQQVK